MADAQATPETKSYRRVTIAFRSGGTDVLQLLEGDTLLEAPNGTYNISQFGGKRLLTYERDDVRSVKVEEITEVLNQALPRSPHDFELK